MIRRAMVFEVRAAMRDERNTNEMPGDEPGPLVNPSPLNIHAGHSAVHSFMQGGVDSVGTERNACQRPPRECGVSQQMDNGRQVYERAAHQQ